MLTTQSEKRWQAGLSTPPLPYPHDLTSGLDRDREYDSFADSVVGLTRSNGRRSVALADLWRIFLEMKAADPDVTDREVINAYHGRHPERPRVTTTTLRNLRYRKRKSEASV